MARLHYGHKSNGDVELQYYRTGDDKPPVLLLHGSTDNGLCWSRLALLLEPSFDVIMMDSRGHGLSSAPEDHYLPQDRAEDVACLIRQLELEYTPIVGHSMGADTAAWTAALYPELVSCIVLEDPPFFDDPQKESNEARIKKAEKWREMILQYKNQSLDELIVLGKKQFPGWREDEFFQWAKAKQQVSPNITRGIEQPRASWREIVKDIRCPGLVLTGDIEKGSIVTEKTSQEISRLWKKAQIVHIANAGHNIRRDQFESYKNAVEPFLEKYRGKKPPQKFSFFKK